MLYPRPLFPQADEMFAASVSLSSVMSVLLRRARPLSWVRNAERGKNLSATFGGRHRPFGAFVKVILTDDVTGTGYRGEQVEIKGGYMRNFLFPGKRAIYATRENVSLYESEDRAVDRERAEALKALRRSRQEMSGMPIIVKRPVQKGGKETTKGVTAKNVSDFLRKSSPFEATEDEIRMPGKGGAVTSLGEHSVFVRTRLSESAVEILQRELGVPEFENLAWVEMKLLVQKMGSRAEAEWEKEELRERLAEEGGEDGQEDVDKEEGGMSVKE